MLPQELFKRSPLRALDEALSGAVGRGSLGVVIARHGAGKTPFLVCVALDRLMRGERVLHVSLNQKVEHVREFYDQIFDEIVRARKVDDLAQTRLEFERARRIHTYLGNSFTVDKLKTAATFLEEHASFEPDLIVIDGYDFAKATPAELSEIIEVARKADAALWMTAVRHRHEPVVDGEGIPAPVAAFKDLPALVLDMQTTDGSIALRLLKPAGSFPKGELRSCSTRSPCSSAKRASARSGARNRSRPRSSGCGVVRTSLRDGLRARRSTRARLRDGTSSFGSSGPIYW